MKSAGLHLLLFIAITITITQAAPSPTPDDELEYYNQWGYLDHSAVKTCLVLNGQIQAVTVENPEKGYYCDYTAAVWTGDKKQALEFCKSNTPYHINVAEPFDDGGKAKTHCQYQINLRCATDYFQIFNRCYKRVLAAFTYDEAKAHCEKDQPSMGSKLAVFYSDLLTVYFEHIYIGAAWVDVPDMGNYYELKEGEENGIYVQDDAWKFHVKPGTILMMPETERYEALCEYTPVATMAEVFSMAQKYQPVYPIIVTDTEALMVSPSYETIDALPVEQTRQGGIAEKFTAVTMGEACKRMSAILNVDSYPLAAFEEMYDNVKDHLEAHRHYLTGAFKHDGCGLGEYRYLNYKTGEEMMAVKNITGLGSQDYCNAFSYSFNKEARQPTMAAMRAPVMCTFTRFELKYDHCPAEWHEFDRGNGTIICHWISTEHLGNKVFTFSQAKARCLEKNSLLAGFESVAEIDSILPTLRKGAHNNADDGHFVEMHYYLSGVIPCATNCLTGYKASWTEQVSRNSKMLNEYEHKHHTWESRGNNIIALRAELNELHTHNNPRDYNGRMYFICTKYPAMKRTLITERKSL